MIQFQEKKNKQQRPRTIIGSQAFILYAFPFFLLQAAADCAEITACSFYAESN